MERLVGGETKFGWPISMLRCTAGSVKVGKLVLCTTVQWRTTQWVVECFVKPIMRCTLTRKWVMVPFVGRLKEVHFSQARWWGFSIPLHIDTASMWRWAKNVSTLRPTTWCKNRIWYSSREDETGSIILYADGRLRFFVKQAGQTSPVLLPTDEGLLWIGRWRN